MFLPLSSPPETIRIVGFDTEDDSKGKVKRLCFADGEHAYHFTRSRDALAWLVSRKGHPKTYVFATNLEYDLVNLIRDGGLERLDVAISAGSGRVIFAKVRGTKIVLVDTLNIAVGCGVQKLGDMIGLPKLPFAPDDPAYCERDTTISALAMRAVQDKLNALGGELKYTAGASAIDLWRRIALPHGLFQATAARLEYLQDSIFGARVEIFRTRASGVLRYYDVNSLYPATLAYVPFPNPNFALDRAPGLDDCGILDASVKVPRDCAFPVLPCRVQLQDGAKLVFPTGSFRARFTTAELAYAVKQGAARVVKVHGGVTYPNVTTRYFSRYVRPLFEARPRDGGAEDLTYKLLLNSLWGKFGQRNIISRMTPLAKAKNPAGKTVIQGFVFEEVAGPWPKHANQIWAAWTLANARIALHRLIRQVIDAGGVPCYVDTDAVIYQGGKPLPTGSGLGELKLEGAYTSGQFILPKCYALTSKSGDKIVAKGVPHEHAASFLFDGLASWIAPFRLREGGLQLANVWRRKERRLLARYDKRRVARDGSTEPLHLIDGELHGQSIA